MFQKIDNTPLCLGDDLFDSSKKLRHKYENWIDTYGNYMSELIGNFIKKADPTSIKSQYLWPWYDPYSPEIVMLDAQTLGQKIRPIQTISTSEYWLCNGGKRHILNATLPRFCNLTNVN